ncbi:hypothetical protein AB751O23_AB_00090 [Chlamydiales bacterium SCGC AB-751-O23]|nr:hypothetical protein AB751O23_AB_00090 [Chlamydiales bacterium SCGC AB-751-O23]
MFTLKIKTCSYIMFNNLLLKVLEYFMQKTYFAPSKFKSKFSDKKNFVSSSFLLNFHHFFLNN